MKSRNLMRAGLIACLPGIVLLLAMIMPGGGHAHAAAQPASPEEPACIACHENLYYLHDTGKFYCVSEASTRCVNCHGGDPLATSMETAHFGRSAHPILDGDASRCMSCHSDDHQARVDQFIALAGIHPAVAASTCQPSQQALLVGPAEVDETGFTPVAWVVLTAGLLTITYLLARLLRAMNG